MTQAKTQTVRPLKLIGGLLLLCFVYVSTIQANDNQTVERLKKIQEKISTVAAKNLGACVAISDGVGFGSGVIISPEGLVLTAGHVMASKDEGQYQIILPSGKTVAAKALGKNLDTDTGMVQITEPGPWPFVEINRDGDFSRGDWVVSLGHSGGFELGRNPPVRSGRILGRSRSQVLTDAVLIGGDSGGPLFDLDGKVIGIHSSIGDSIAENRHVTMNVFVRDWDRLKRGDSWGRLPNLNKPEPPKRRGLIGVRLNLNAPNALIRAVDQGMPASDAGVQVGDVVTEFDSVTIISGRQLIDLIKQKHAGDECPMTILRDGRLIRFDITLR